MQWLVSWYGSIMSDSSWPSGWHAIYVGLKLSIHDWKRLFHQALDYVYPSAPSSPGSSEAFNIALQDDLLQTVALSPADVVEIIEGLLEEFDHFWSTFGFS